MLAPRNKLWPSNPGIVELALDLLGVTAGSRLADWGCGDGPALFAAVSRGATAIGWEIHEERSEGLREEVVRRGLQQQVVVITGNALEAELPIENPITHVYLFLIARGLRLMLPTLRRAAALLPGKVIPVVTVLYSFEGLTPVETRKDPVTSMLYHLWLISSE